MISGWVERGDDSRGQSEVIGVVLLLAITIAGATAIVAFGAVAVNDTEQAVTTGAAEQSMTQLDSKASLIAHGQSDSGRIQLSGASDASYQVDSDAGWMNITIRNRSTGAVETKVLNESLGAVVYQDDGKTIAYQGGGVWRSNGNGSVMVSPPEFHYEGTTLTLPLVVVNGSDSLGDRVRIQQSGQATAEYPTTGRTNPLTDGIVVVEVHSEYYEAWGRYFEQRTAGDVSYMHSSQTVRINLTVPFNTSFSSVVATTEEGGITLNCGGPFCTYPSPSQTGVSYPPLDSRIENKIDDCQTGGGCNTTEPSTITSADTYYWNNDLTGSLTVDNPGGNVTVVVNGEFNPSSVEIKNVASDHVVTVYVREDFAIGGSSQVNDVDGNASEFAVVVHSDGEVDFNGNPRFVGLTYAPESTCDLNGNADIEGGIICETMDVNGNPNSYSYNSSIQSINIGINSGITRITYLHVSVTEVNVTAA